MRGDLFTFMASVVVYLFAWPYFVAEWLRILKRRLKNETD
jgi:hypothetical protein